MSLYFGLYHHRALWTARSLTYDPKILKHASFESGRVDLVPYMQSVVSGVERGGGAGLSAHQVRSSCHAAYQSGATKVIVTHS